jgi:hypothetical protein
MKLFKHNLSGNYYRLVKSYKGDINTFLQVDKKNKVIIKPKKWSNEHQETKAILIGFSKLTQVN